MGGGVRLYSILLLQLSIHFLLLSVQNQLFYIYNPFMNVRRSCDMNVRRSSDTLQQINELLQNNKLERRGNEGGHIPNSGTILALSGGTENTKQGIWSRQGRRGQISN
jgi:hypothetical protein